VVFPGVPVETARWFEPVAGVGRIVEQALARGAPSDEVLRRIQGSVTFWRQNRRIALGVVAALAITAAATERATRMTRLAGAVELALRAEDRLVNDPSRTEDALRLGVESLGSTPTGWGESAMRKGLMLLPAFGGSVEVERQGSAAFGPGGVLAQWSRDTARSAAFRRSVSRFALIDPRRGTFVRRPVELPGIVRDVRFTADGSAVAVGVGSEVGAPVESVYWIRRGGGDPRRFAAGPAGAFALDPADGSLVVANGAVERWAPGRTPVKTAEWRLPDVRALAFSPDGARLYALRSDRLVSIDPRDPSAPVVTLARVASTEDAALLATEGHVVVVADSIRTWRLSGARWDHAYDVGTGQAAVAGDRLAVWTRSGATIRDLGDQGADSHAVRAGCEAGLGRPAALLDLAVSADGRRAALACGDGTAKVVSTADGTPLALAPVADAVPRAVHLDERGGELLLYATTPALTGPRAWIASWTVLNGSSNRIGGSDTALAFALDPGGGSLAAVFETAPLAYGLAIHDPLTGRERARADVPLRGPSFRMAFDAGRVALADEREVSLWRVDAGRLRLEGVFGVENAIALQFGGRDAARLAVSSKWGDSAEVTVLERGPGGWRKRPPVRAGSWAMPGMPDAIDFSPAAVSDAGWIASLADTADPHGSTVRVARGAGAPITLRHGDPVTLLRFTGPGELLAATRSGEIWSWSLDGARPRRMRIGRHGSAVMALVAADRDRVLAIDLDDVVRMWALGTSTRDIGLRGLMEFPITRSGITGSDAPGARALGFSGERLVTAGRHAGGLFAHAWAVPRRERLPAVMAERLGVPPR
jgi:hypothetical protein